MPDPIAVTVTIPPGISASGVLLSQEITNAIKLSGLGVEREAKKAAPVATGTLRRSITSAVSTLNGSPAAIVSAPLPYAASVESGSRPHTPPMAPIQRWADRKGLSGGAIWNSIRKRGTKAHPYMKPAFDEKRQSIVDRLQAAISAAIEKVARK